MIIKTKNILLYLTAINLIFLSSHIFGNSEKLISYLENTPLIDILEQDHVFDINNQDYNQAKQILWDKFRVEAKNLADRYQEHETQQLKYADKVMRFSKNVQSNSPDNKALYIALHGGGQTSPRVNDSQWEHMKIYYLDSVKQGTYVATRGVTDTWNLHFVDESYPLYDKLIENMVVYDGIDPNQVYLTGFSAGGDGVYQITPRMNDRFAAANMSAGHHNWISFENLYNTPMLLQMGEYDSAYKRNTVAAENYLELNKLQSKYNGGYKHDLFLHLGGSHNSWQDNDARENKHSIIANPQAWLEHKDRSSIKVNSNAITWMSKYKRNPLPNKIVWDVTTNAKLRTSSMGAQWLDYNHNATKLSAPVNLNYWLSVSENNADKQKLIANIDKTKNTVNIEQVEGVNNFSVYLHPDLLDLNKDIIIKIQNQNLLYKVNQFSTSLMLRSMLERSDYNWSFPAEVKLSYNSTNNNWEVIS